MEDVKDREDDELIRLENSLMSGIPCDNAYFMSVYTTCMEIIEDRVINTELKKRILRPAVKAVERAFSDSDRICKLANRHMDQSLLF